MLDLPVFISKHRLCSGQGISRAYMIFFLGAHSPDYENCSNVQYVNKQPRCLREGYFLGLTEILTTGPLAMIPHQVETQFIASQPFPVSVSGLIPSLSATPVPCWYRKCQYQTMVTQTVWEYPHQLGCQTLHYKTLPRISPLIISNPITYLQLNGDFVFMFTMSRSPHPVFPW